MSEGWIEAAQEILGGGHISRDWDVYFARTDRGIGLVDPGTGLIVAANPALTQMHGGHGADLAGSPFDDLVVSGDSPVEFQRLLSSITEFGYVSVESRHRRRDGSEFPIGIEGILPSQLDGGSGLLVIWADDLSGRHALEAERREAEQHFEEAFRSAPIGMALVSLEGLFLRVNPSLCGITGYSAEELTGRTFQEITHPDDLEADLNFVAQLIAGEIPAYQMEKRYFTGNGEMIWVLLSVSLVRGEDGDPIHFISQIQDISERKRFEADLQELAERDAGTGLWNRRRFEQDLRRQVNRSARYGEQAGLLLVDLDNFKSVNDTHGHRAGDQVLSAVGEALAARIRASDAAARIGGDEFALLIAKATPGELLSIGESIRRRIADLRVPAGDDDIQITASIGVTPISSRSGSDDEVLVAADRAMYGAKRSGRDRTVISDPAEPQ